MKRTCLSLLVVGFIVLQFGVGRNNQVLPIDILRTVTVNPAEAIGAADRLGAALELAPSAGGEIRLGPPPVLAVSGGPHRGVGSAGHQAY